MNEIHYYRIHFENLFPARSADEAFQLFSEDPLEPDWQVERVQDEDLPPYYQKSLLELRCEDREERLKNLTTHLKHMKTTLDMENRNSPDWFVAMTHLLEECFNEINLQAPKGA